VDAVDFDGVAASLVMDHRHDRLVHDLTAFGAGVVARSVGLGR